MTLTDLDKLEAAATPGEFQHTHISDTLEAIHIAHEDGTHTGLGHLTYYSDAKFLVALRNAWPKLSAALRAGEAWLSKEDYAGTQYHSKQHGWYLELAESAREAFRAALKELEKGMIETEKTVELRALVKYYIEETAALRSDIARYRAALEWYADRANWNWEYRPDQRLDGDNGKRAREALESSP